MAVLWNIKPYSDAVHYFKEFLFYNKPIEKPELKRLKNIDALPFYEQLSVIKTDQVFRVFKMWYKVEIINRKDPVVQLEAIKSSVKDLFNDLLNETKGFKYQSTVNVLLKNTIPIKKFNLLQFVLIHSQKQW